MNFKKLGIAMLAYSMAVSIIPTGLTANASTGVKDFRGQHESGYVNNVVYRDNGDVQLSYDNLELGTSGDYYMTNGILTKNEVSSSVRLSKEEVLEEEFKIETTGASSQYYIKNLKTNERYKSSDLFLKLEKIISEYYDVEKEYIIINLIKSNNDDIFAAFSISKGYFSKRGYISEKGKIIEPRWPNEYKVNNSKNEKLSNVYISEEDYYSNGYIINGNSGSPIIFNEKGDVLKSLENQFLVGVFEDKMTTRNTECIRKYKLQNNKVELIEEVKVNNLGHYYGNVTLDSKGEIWVVEGGNISIVKNKKLELRYKVDGYVSSVKVYDENNMIVDDGGWYLNSNLIISDGKVLTPYRKENINGKEYLYNIKNELQKGWKNVQGKDYYFDNNGVMQKNKWIGDYYVGADGACYYNKWVGDYYCGADGKYVKNKWAGDYYCGADGKYVKNKWAGNYYCGADGKYVKNKWVGDYYCGADGKYVKNKWAGDYYCGTDGKYVKNKWAGDYYCGADGKYVKNAWVKTSGKWYYCAGNGKYLKNTSQKIGNKTYKFDAKGVCLNP